MPGWPPEYTNRPCSGLMIGMSIGRTERTGPISSGSWEWNTATSRETSNSTIVSQTTSAYSSPDWGRAALVFSILTAMAGRCAISAGATPVRGHTSGTTGSGGATRAASIVGVTVTGGGVTGGGVGALHAPTPAVARTEIDTATTRSRRIAARGCPDVRVGVVVERATCNSSSPDLVGRAVGYGASTPHCTAHLGCRCAARPPVGTCRTARFGRRDGVHPPAPRRAGGVGPRVGTDRPARWARARRRRHRARAGRPGWQHLRFHRRTTPGDAGRRGPAGLRMRHPRAARRTRPLGARPAGPTHRGPAGADPIRRRRRRARRPADRPVRPGRRRECAGRRTPAGRAPVHLPCAHPAAPDPRAGRGRHPVSYTHLRAHETRHDLVCRLLLEKKKKKK